MNVIQLLGLSKREPRESASVQANADDRLLATVLAYCVKPAFMQRNPLADDPFMDSVGNDQLVTYITQALARISTHGGSPDMVFEWFSDLETIVTNTLELRQRRLSLPPAAQKQLEDLLTSVRLSIGAGDVFFRVRALKYQLRALARS